VSYYFPLSAFLAYSQTVSVWCGRCMSQKGLGSFMVVWSIFIGSEAWAIDTMPVGVGRPLGRCRPSDFHSRCDQLDTGDNPPITAGGSGAEAITVDRQGNIFAGEPRPQRALKYVGR
jgi:hypothetical protein